MRARCPYKPHLEIEADVISRKDANMTLLRCDAVSRCNIGTCPFLAKGKVADSFKDVVTQQNGSSTLVGATSF